MKLEKDWVMETVRVTSIICLVCIYINKEIKKMSSNLKCKAQKSSQCSVFLYLLSA